MTQTTKIESVATSADGTEHLLSIVERVPKSDGVTDVRVFSYHLLSQRDIIEIGIDEAKDWVMRNIESPDESIDAPHSVMFGFFECEPCE